MTEVETATARQVVLRTLDAHKQELSRKYGVTRLGIFGSVARGQATEGSDVDIVVDMPPDLFLMVHMREDLERLLGVSVDLVRRHKYLDPYLRSRIEEDAIYV